MRSPHTDTRMHAIDVLRTLAMVTLFFFHVAHIFDLDRQASIKNAETSLAASVFTFFVIQWVNPLLFLLAGTSAWFSLRSRANRAYFRERVERLFIPLLFGSVVLIPWIGYMSALNHARFDGPYWEYIPIHVEQTWAWLKTPEFHHGLIALYYTSWHLWFLGYLLVFSVLALRLFRSEARLSWLATLCERRVGLVVLGAPLAVCRVALGAAFPAYLDWADTLVYFTCFVYGWGLMTDSRFVRAVQRDALLWSIVGCVTYALVLGTQALGYLPRWLAEPGYTTDYLAYQGLLAITTWAWVLALTGCGLRWLNVQHPALHYAHGAVMPFYVLHQVAVATAGTLVVAWDAGIAPKFVVISSVAFAATVLSYEFLVRRSRLLRVLFGLKADTGTRADRRSTATGAHDPAWGPRMQSGVTRVSN